MFEVKRATRVVADPRRWLLLSIALVMLIGASLSARAQSGFDVTSVPRPDGAEIVADRASSMSTTYQYPASVADTILATEKSLNAGGWMRYRTPDREPTGTNLRFKNGRHGIYVHFTRSEGKADRSRISYRHNNSIPANVPFPGDATEIVYDENRPYLRCITGLTVDAALEFFTEGLATEGWSQLRPATIEARYPHAKLDSVESGTRTYFNRDGRERQQPPVMLTLQRASGDKTVVDLRIAPFALPQDLPLYKESAGLPAPERFKSAGSIGSADSVRRESTALVLAEIPVVLAFYRRELAVRGWQEQAAGASISDTAVRLTFTQPDGIAVLELGQRYDLTTVSLVAQLSEAAVAARARVKKEADAKWMRDARQQAAALIAASEAKRLAAVAAVAGAPVETLRPLVNAATPIPLPENANAVKFNGEDGKLDFTSPSTPKSIAAFYRNALKPLGWKEGRSVIDKPTMVRMDFTKGPQKLAFTVMLFGGNARVSANGSGLVVPADPNRETERLEAEEKSGFPVPTRHTLSGQSAWTIKTGQVAFRRELNAQVPSDIGSVLAFYRRELTRRAWKELPDGAVVKPENVLLAYAAPDGPALLKLGREGKETTINIVVKIPAEAEKAGILPPAGKARIALGNLDDTDASVTIDRKTIKVLPDPASSKKPGGPMLDLKPGKYKYVLKRAGKANQAGEVTVAADDTWMLLVGPGGILPMQMY